ncbi:MAG: hypothetical protein DRJ03_08170 [Chloroflexi bacterium]|nr:MAG: hypothetical protein DRJ03_08170 [Chloroflexota bacterium]
MSKKLSPAEVIKLVGIVHSAWQKLLDVKVQLTPYRGRAKGVAAALKAVENAISKISKLHNELNRYKWTR